EDVTHSHLLPLWWRTRSPERSRTLLFPLYYRQTENLGGDASSFTMVGGNLWIDARSPESREFGVLYPLTRFRRTPDSATDQALFLYSSQRIENGDGTSTRRFRLSPLFFSGRRLEERSAHEWWHWISSQSIGDEHRFRVMPFLFDSVRTPESLEWNVLGAWIRHRDVEDRESLSWVAPIYFHQRLGRESDPDSTLFAIVPLFYRTWSALEGRTTTSVLFPLFTHSSTEDGTATRTSLFWPLAEIRRSEGFRSTRVFPLFDSQTWDSGASRFDLSFLYRSQRAAPQTEVGGLGTRDGYLGLQLVRNARGEHTRTIAVHPFLFGYHRDDTRDLVHWENLFFVNRYHREGAELGYSALGLIHGGADREHRWHSTFPLYFSESFASGTLPHFSLPTWIHLYSSQEDGQQSRWSLLGYVANGWRRKASGDSEFRVLYRGATWIRRGSYTERVVQPLFDYEHDDRTGESYFSLLKILYIQKRDSRMADWRRYVLGIPLQW
ncbi:MAG: hypothetical protein KDC38_13695, partial [Planctomycetes bacterium]|nr:hypothetical protein [Planctomycetota bacterium]